MNGGLALGIDVGTGSAKATLLDPERGPVGQGTGSYSVQHPRPGWAEQEPDDWFAGVRSAVRSACDDAGVRGDAIDSVAVSGQGAALVLLDGAGRPVRPALIHLDQRAAEEARRLADSPTGAAVHDASGNVVGAWNVAAKLAWVRTWEPEAYGRTRYATSAAGFVLAQLVGRQVQSASDAGISDLFDLHGRTWSQPVLDTLDVPGAWLPAVADATEEVGRVSATAADELGLSRHTRVVAGGEDTSSAALAAGVVAVGDAYLSLGTAAVVGVSVDRGHTREPALLTFPHVLRGQDLLSGSMSSAGAAVTWCATLTGTSPDELLAEAEQVPPGAGGVVFLPYLAGELHPINDPAARGVFSGLSLSTTRAELGRSVVEGSATAVAHNLAVARAAGAVPTTLRATGRPTRSRAWMQSVADSTGLPVECVTEEGASLGDAILAASRDDQEAARLAVALSHVHARYEPEPAAHRAACRRREIAARLYRATRDDG